MHAIQVVRYSYISFEQEVFTLPMAVILALLEAHLVLQREPTQTL